MKGNSFCLLNAALIEAKRRLNLEPRFCRELQFRSDRKKRIIAATNGD
jgi:hypothetical protein